MSISSSSQIESVTEFTKLILKKQIEVLTVIPKSNSIRKGFLESFYFIIENETETEYYLRFNFDKLVQTQYPVYIKDGIFQSQSNFDAKINDFCVYLNHTLDNGTWVAVVTNIYNSPNYVPWQVFNIEEFEKNKSNFYRNIQVFLSYPNTDNHYGYYTLNEYNWNQRLKNYTDLFTREKFEYILTYINNHSFLSQKNFKLN